MIRDNIYGWLSWQRFKSFYISIYNSYETDRIIRRSCHIILCKEYLFSDSNFAMKRISIMYILTFTTLTILTFSKWNFWTIACFSLSRNVSNFQCNYRVVDVLSDIFLFPSFLYIIFGEQDVFCQMHLFNISKSEDSWWSLCLW